ncbi:sulfotransferase family 2 domain-containing protein [Alloyangia pacifica]|uniref:Sulfotransferase family protein n=1 Tax=Alloyangia pacifica TaxID=311180 RepID=A0A1I6RKB5_9RHOB|nr:sulfotransferase family 2 domain-containing protein [Alloyangia pacifica]SDI70221.1 Sulfotransferase family protein [Alloyangia pacifica]SFS65171.1 Sulfotransferase family protein [Alloyangia pacifica]
MTDTKDQKLSRAEIDCAYRLLLGRQANPAELDHMLARGHTHDSLRRVFMSSAEFQRKAGNVQRPGPGANATAPERAKTLIHLHVPKSAGSTLTSILAPTCPQAGRMTISDNDLQRLKVLPQQRRSELRFVFGHLSYGVGRLLPQDCAYITVLREPGTRLLSYFRYIQRVTDHPLHGPVSQKQMNFGDFLEYAAATPVARLEPDNGQVRRLAGFGARIDSLGTEDQLFRQALHNIFSEDVVYGLTEHFDDFLDRLTRRKIISHYSDARLNTAPEKTDIAPILEGLTGRQKEIFETFTRWDRTFYEICKTAYFA